MYSQILDNSDSTNKAQITKLWFFNLQKISASFMSKSAKWDVLHLCTIEKNCLTNSSSTPSKKSQAKSLPFFCIRYEPLTWPTV